MSDWHGTEFSDSDKVIFRRLKNSLEIYQDLKTSAKINSQKNFKLSYRHIVRWDPTFFHCPLFRILDDDQWIATRIWRKISLATYFPWCTKAWRMTVMRIQINSDHQSVWVRSANIKLRLMSEKLLWKNCSLMDYHGKPILVASEWVDLLIC